MHSCVPATVCGSNFMDSDNPVTPNPCYIIIYIYIYNHVYDIIIYPVPFRINVTQIVNQLYNLCIQHPSNGSCHLWLFFTGLLCAFSCDCGLYCFRVHTSNDWCPRVQRHSGRPHDRASCLKESFTIYSSPDTDGEGNFHTQIISP